MEEEKKRDLGMDDEMIENKKKEEQFIQSRQRVFISMKQQQNFIDIQRAKHEQKEAKGMPIPQLAGFKAPKKVIIGRSFISEDQGKSMIKSLRQEKSKLLDQRKFHEGR